MSIRSKKKDNMCILERCLDAFNADADVDG